jgi:hypothetical protein
MNRPEVYHKSVQILYDAYFNDTLEHGNCFACAVGNLVAGNLGLLFESGTSFLPGKIVWVGYRTPGVHPAVSGWAEVIDGYGLNLTKYKEEPKRQIDSTGYTPQELATIEYQFEFGERKTKDYMFDGLVNVLEVLKEIHEVTDEDLIQANHKRFKEHHERKSQTV